MNALVAEKRLSFADYLHYDDGTENRYELIDGALALMSPPTVLHMLIAKSLERCFDHEIERLQHPWKTFREAGVRTGFQRSRYPDVCVVTNEQAEAMLHQSAVFEEPPLLVVEIVSVESAVRDYRYKRSEYAAANIGEYWIVDPLNGTVNILLLEQGWYEYLEYRDEDVLISRVFAELRLTAARILAAAGA